MYDSYEDGRLWYHNNVITTGQGNLTKLRIAAAHGWCSGIEQVVPVCTLPNTCFLGPWIGFCLTGPHFTVLRFIFVYKSNVFYVFCIYCHILYVMLL